MRVLTNGLDKELTKLLKKLHISKVDIATAWATEGGALNALEDHKKRCKGKLTVRTMAGYSGNHTTPGALRRLAKLGKVRLVDGQNGMFHVKLFLLHGSGGSMAWVGSANFTGRGFGSNEELLYETPATTKLQEWFDQRWADIGPQPYEPDKYCKEWKKPEHPLLGVDPEPTKQGRPDPPIPDANNGPNKIVFVQEGMRPPPETKGGNGNRLRPHGEVQIGLETHSYKSAQECLKVVLEALHQRDRRFFGKCWRDPRFHKRGGNSHYIARNQSDLGSKHFRKDATKLRDNWWLSNQTQTGQKWRLIEAAAAVADLKVVPGQMWQAEKNGKEVGF